VKISVAQTKPLMGDLSGNLAAHKRLIDIAIADQADVIIFPELSLTGYEPTMSNSLAMQINDQHLNDFQQISNEHNITIGVGVPTSIKEGTCISIILFQPNQMRLVYSKKYLHPDEEEFFVRGENFPFLKINHCKVALAICYELSVPEHASHAVEGGAEIYVASVAKSVKGIDPAQKRLRDIAAKYNIPVLMANSIGRADGDVLAGRTTAWNKSGELLSQLDDQQEGIITFDTETQVTSQRII